MVAPSRDVSGDGRLDPRNTTRRHSLGACDCPRTSPIRRISRTRPAPAARQPPNSDTPEKRHGVRNDCNNLGSQLPHAVATTRCIRQVLREG